MTTTTWGINNESRGRVSYGWTYPLSRFRSILDLVDGRFNGIKNPAQENQGIPVYINDEKTVGFVDKNDGKGPGSQASAVKNNLYRFAKKYNVKARTFYFSAVKGAKNLLHALNSKTSTYDLKRVIDLLKNTGLTFNQLIKLQGKKGDELIKELLTMLGYNPEEFKKGGLAKAKELKDAVDAYNKNPNDTTAAVLKTKLAALKAFIGKFKPSPLSQKVLEDAGKAVKSEEVRQARLKKSAVAAKNAEAARIAKQRREFFIVQIRKAGSLSALVALITSNKDLEFPVSGTKIVYKPAQIRAYLGDKEIRKAIGERALTMIKDDPRGLEGSSIAKTLQPYIREALKENQRLISFKYKDKQHYALAERGQDNRWKIVSQGMPFGNYRIAGNKGSLYIIKKNPWYRSNQKIKIEILSRPGKQIDLQPGERVVKTRGYTIVWKDDGDGRIDANERGSVKIYRPGDSKPIIVGLSTKFYQLIDRDMNWDTMRDDTNNEITAGELDRALGEIDLYAAEMGLNRKQALTAFNKADTFKKVDIETMRLGRIEIEKAIGSGVLGKGVDVEKYLIDKGFTKRISALVATFVKNNHSKPGFSLTTIAKFMNRAAWCSQFLKDVREKLYGLSGEYFPADKPLDPKYVNKNTALLWLQGNYDEANGKDSDESDLARKKEKDRIYSKAAKKQGPAYQRQLAQNYMSKLSAAKAAEFLAKASEKGKWYIEGIDKDTSVLGLMVKLYVKEGNLQKAFEYAKRIKSDQTYEELAKQCIQANDVKQLALAYDIAKLIKNREIKWKLFLDIARRYSMEPSKIRQRALKIIDEIYTVKNDWVTPYKGRNDQPLTIAQYRERLQIRLETPLTHVIERRKAFKGDKLVDDPKKIDAAVKGLKDILKKAGVTKSEKAFANMVLAEILTARAKRFTTVDKVKALTYYNRAMRALRRAHDLFKELGRAGGPKQTIYANAAQQMLIKMCYEIAFKVKGLEKVEIPRKKYRRGVQVYTIRKGKIKTRKLRKAKDIVKKTIHFIPDSASVPGNGGRPDMTGKKFKKGLLGGGGGGPSAPTPPAS